MNNSDAEQLIIAHPELLAKGEITIFGHIMDRSGSMLQHGDVPRQAINESIEKLRAHPNAESAIGFVITFADDARFDIPLQPLKGMPLLADYRADGNTMLYGTVLQALIETLKLKTDLEAKGLKVNLELFVYTDGMDSFKLQPVKERLAHLAGQALEGRAHLALRAIGRYTNKFAIAQDMGFPPGDAVQIESSAEAIHHSVAASTQRTYRTMTGVGYPVPSTPVPPSSR